MIQLYTAATPNGRKASIALEELDLPYETHRIDLRGGEQKQEWFRRINPNARIPAIVDKDEDDFAVFESGAILIYLAEKAGVLLGNSPRERSVVIQWLMFQMGGVGPMMGQLNVFNRYAPERLEYAIGRYQREVRRLFEVLDRQLADADYLAGDYSIADIANYCWVSAYEYSGADITGLDHLTRWLGRIAERPAVIRGREVGKQEKSEEEREDVVQTARGMLV